MNKLLYWFRKHSRQITWFFVVVCITLGIINLLIGNIVTAAIQFVVAFMNYLNT